jgi:hypothetical protein
MKLLLILCAALVSCVQITSAQTQKTEIFASVGDITDKRTTGTFSSECTVDIKFTGDIAVTASTVRAVTVTKAIDDTGRDLKTDDKEHFTSFPDMNPRGQTVLKKEITLKNPSRNARLIKLIEGQASFFAPTEANGGKLIIKDALAHPGQPFDAPILKQLKIQVTYHTKESIEAAKQNQKAKATAGDKIGEGLAEAFGSMFSGFGGSEKGVVDLQIIDPDHRFIDAELLDANGKPIKSQGRMTSGEFHHFGLKAAPPAGTQLVLYLATPEATVNMPFRLENVPLP